jgi:hypothetical protein
VNDANGDVATIGDPPLVTVTAHVAVLPPSAVVTVIVAVPAAIGVTTPPATVAIFALLVDQVTFLFAASEGATVAVIVPVAPPAVNVIVVGVTVIALTGATILISIASIRKLLPVVPAMLPSWV